MRSGGVRVNLNKEWKFFVKIQNIRNPGEGEEGQVGRGQGACERRNEVIVKIQ